MPRLQERSPHSVGGCGGAELCVINKNRFSKGPRQLLYCLSLAPIHFDEDSPLSSARLSKACKNPVNGKEPTGRPLCREMLAGRWRHILSAAPGLAFKPCAARTLLALCYLLFLLVIGLVLPAFALDL